MTVATVNDITTLLNFYDISFWEEYSIISYEYHERYGVFYLSQGKWRHDSYDDIEQPATSHTLIETKSDILDIAHEVVESK